VPGVTLRNNEPDEALFEQILARMREAPDSFAHSVAGLRRAALDKLFHEHAHESPESCLRRLRTDHACRLIEAGNFPTAAGDEFHSRIGMTPEAYAGLKKARQFTLHLPAGYRVREVLDFYGRDPASVSERVYPGGLDKALLIEGKPSLVEIRFEGGQAVVRTDGSCAFAAHRAVTRMLGLDSDAKGFERRFAKDPLLGALIRRQRGLRIPLTPQPWEALAWAIMGQQISLKAAVALRRELITAFGEGHRGGLRAHPSAEVIAGLDVDTLRKLKFSRSKAEYLIEAARAVASGQIPMDNLRELSSQRAGRLLGSVRGIGPWTIQYVFLRGFGLADCLPSGDAGLAQGLGRLCGERPDERRIREMMARFAPFRSYATYHVWASLKEGSEDAV
jgi:AraC family transcriptional regulator of adaptative response / DNA-3-methyladenine glycosylase II